jgi:RNA polymerase sigma factor (sigma-70 family)
MANGEDTVAALVVAARNGDHGAWLELVARFDGMVHAVAARFRLQDADADDVVQNTWMNAFEQIGRLQAPERFGGWLRAIARNECRDACARADRERPADGLDDAVEEPSPGPELLVLRAESDRAVRTAVAELPRRSRVLVETLFFAPQNDYAAAARITGMPLGGIGPTRARVLLVLRDRLERRGHPVARAG